MGWAMLMSPHIPRISIFDAGQEALSDKYGLDGRVSPGDSNSVKFHMLSGKALLFMKGETLVYL